MLLLEIKGTTVADWLLVRLCHLLSHIRNEEIRLEIISTWAEVLKVWKEAIPASWNELQVYIEMIKSYISCSHLCPKLICSDSTWAAERGLRYCCIEQRLCYPTPNKRLFRIKDIGSVQWLIFGEFTHAVTLTCSRVSR